MASRITPLALDPSTRTGDSVSNSYKTYSGPRPTSQTHSEDAISFGDLSIFLSVV